MLYKLQFKRLWAVNKLFFSTKFSQTSKVTEMSKDIYVIAAVDENYGIGYQGKIPWHLKGDMAMFAKLTKSNENPNKMNAVIMGRKTWESIPKKNRPLADRVNIVLSHSYALENADENVFIYTSFETALDRCNETPLLEAVEDIWVIGGASIYEQAMSQFNCRRIYLTRIKKSYECDVFMPKVDTTKFTLTSDPRVPDSEQEENGVKYVFEVYERNETV